LFSGLFFLLCMSSFCVLFAYWRKQTLPDITN
jgi:hypothetical protein